MELLGKPPTRPVRASRRNLRLGTGSYREPKQAARACLALQNLTRKSEPASLLGLTSLPLYAPFKKQLL